MATKGAKGAKKIQFLRFLRLLVAHGSTQQRGNRLASGSDDRFGVARQNPVPLRRQACSPVSKAQREGVQVADGEWALVNRRPHVASLSMFGVFTRVAP